MCSTYCEWPDGMQTKFCHRALRGSVGNRPSIERDTYGRWRKRHS